MNIINQPIDFSSYKVVLYKNSCRLEVLGNWALPEEYCEVHSNFNLLAS